MVLFANKFLYSDKQGEECKGGQTFILINYIEIRIFN